MKLCYFLLTLLYFSCAKEQSKKYQKVTVDKKSASKFLNYKQCMKAMKCGPSIHSECSDECKSGNTKEEIEEHVERLKKIDRFLKDAKNKKLVSRRKKDLSDDDLSDSTSDDDSDVAPSISKQLSKSKKVGKAVIPDSKAAIFLSYKECMRRMNCGKKLKKECSEECKEGNTEEEIEEYGSFLRNIEKYVEEAKRRKRANDLDTTDSDDDDSTDSDDSTTDTSTSDNSTDSDSSSTSTDNDDSTDDTTDDDDSTDDTTDDDDSTDNDKKK